MGSYATLKLGAGELAWKYYVPPVLSFLFTENDFIAVPYEDDIANVNGDADEDETDIDDGEADDQGWAVLGYRTTPEDAIRNLERFGYTLDFFAHI